MIALEFVRELVQPSCSFCIQASFRCRVLDRSTYAYNYIIVGDTADLDEDSADAAVSEFVDFCKPDVYMFGDKVCLDDEFDALDNLNYYQGIWNQIKESYMEE